ncbi:PRD domain-containing protein [Streptococcus massiliensis]|uniref:PRD domain/Sigma-54 interaction domain containing transcriptional regulator n=1 Tax=Streptococcus massiliensis TaxID=313439 RepID=A0A380KZA1_9STRE|nr:PRD domain-containing protein [Streptococcus massiliensis]SUN76414.1 PRD domain/Sigma-54 interaction domain containing transcriptional regulator [Streptococcus massiliensis]
MRYTKDILLDYINDHSEDFNEGIITIDLANRLNMQRSNVSALLNTLTREGKLLKEETRPVKYWLASEKQQELSAFKYLVGNDNILKNIVSLSKASLVYPEHRLASLIVGSSGTGKSYLAQLMYRFATEEGILSGKEKFKKINCRHLILSDKKTAATQLSDLLNQASKDFVFIDHLEVLDLEARDIVLSKIDQQNRIFSLVCAMDYEADNGLYDFITSKFPVVLKLPSLSERSLSERLELITHFFKNEAARLGKDIHLNAEILRDLLLYNCENNIKELKKDIRIACATAYLRDFEVKTKNLTLYLQDFTANVRKGFIFYPDFRDEIEHLISQKFNYTFTAEGLSQSETSKRYDKSIYQVIDDRVLSLRNEGRSKNEVHTIVSEELDEQFKEIGKKNNLDKNALIKVVGEEFVTETEKFIQQCEILLNQKYSTDLLSAIVLHLWAAVERKFETPLPTLAASQSVTDYPELWQLACSFISYLNQTFAWQLREDEANSLTLLIAQFYEKEKSSNTVQVLIAMHGNATATSISRVVTSLIRTSSIYAYDLNLDKDLRVVYEELKFQILNIEQGKGILLLYDMGSIKTMAETISQETGIQIKAIEIPVTLVALESVRMIDGSVSLKELHQNVTALIEQGFHFNTHLYNRATHHQVILTLCVSGKGAALSMKDYIDKNLDTTNLDIIPMAGSDKIYLRKKIKEISQLHKIIAIVGTYNPKINGYRFISASQLYGSSTEQLAQLFYKDKVMSEGSMDYSEIYKYLKEQQPSINISRVKEVLPRVVRKIKKLEEGFTQSQEVGLFVHMACLISHLQQGRSYPELPNVDTIIAKHKRLYHQLREICFEIECEFEIEIPEAEYASMIRTIKEI